MVKDLARVTHDRYSLEQAVVLARYHTDWPTSSSPRYSTYQAIATMLRISPSTVRNICMSFTKDLTLRDLTKKSKLSRIKSKQLKKKKCFGVLSREHIDYLTSEEMMKK